MTYKEEWDNENGIEMISKKQIKKFLLTNSEDKEEDID